MKAEPGTRAPPRRPPAAVRVPRFPRAPRIDVRHVPRDVVTERVHVAPGRLRRGLLPSWRRPNRRVGVQLRSPVLWLLEAVVALARRLLLVTKALLATAALVGALYGWRVALAHVIASPHFAVREVRLSSTTHVERDELAELAGVAVGDRLLAVDTDAVASRLTRHPWIAAARVRRELPSVLAIDVVERQAAALAIIAGSLPGDQAGTRAGLYLIDDRGHPFKRATLDETSGLVVLTGVSRDEYAELRSASEATLREALALLAEYQHPDSLAVARTAKGLERGRPALSEIHIDARNGYTLVLYDGGARIHLGRGDFSGKLARFDEIVADLRSTPPSPAAAVLAGSRSAVATLDTVHLEGPTGDRVPIRFKTLAE